MIVLGRITEPYGVRGWVRIHPFGDDPLDWGKMPEWWVGNKPDSVDPADWSARKLRACRAHGKGVVALLDGCDDRSAAESLEGLYIAAPREAMPAPAEDEYYWGDLVGLRVIGQDDAPLGTVRSLLETGAHAVLDIVDGDIERLIPFVGAYVQKVDIAAGELHVAWQADW
ncbi:MAG: ribosome maturation factor RimM [Rhodocyclaceae bacterium]